MAEQSPVTPMPAADRAQWVEDHLEAVPERVAGFLDFGGQEWRGAALLDLGCGDGLISVGLARRFELARLVGVDEARVDEDLLQSVLADRKTVRPASVTFEQHPAGPLPYPEGSFDVVFTWSVVEHVADLPAFFDECRRCLRPGGMLFVQTWPLWSSEHGSHLWPWFPQGFVHLWMNQSEIERHVEHAESDDPAWRRHVLGAFGSTNQTSADDIQLALRRTGLRLAKVAVETNTFHVPPEVQDVPLSKLAVAGLMLLAVRDA